MIVKTLSPQGLFVFAREIYNIFYENNSVLEERKERMKIKDLKEEYRGLYNAVIKGIYTEINKGTIWYEKDHIEIDEIKELSIDDLFGLFTEEQIKKWRYIGETRYSQLVSLRG